MGSSVPERRVGDRRQFTDEQTEVPRGAVRYILPSPRLSPESSDNHAEKSEISRTPLLNDIFYLRVGRAVRRLLDTGYHTEISRKEQAIAKQTDINDARRALALGFGKAALLNGRSSDQIAPRLGISPAGLPDLLAAIGLPTDQESLALQGFDPHEAKTIEELVARSVDLTQSDLH